MSTTSAKPGLQETGNAPEKQEIRRMISEIYPNVNFLDVNVQFAARIADLIDRVKAQQLSPQTASLEKYTIYLSSVGYFLASGLLSTNEAKVAGQTVTVTQGAQLALAALILVFLGLYLTAVRLDRKRTHHVNLAVQAEAAKFSDVFQTLAARHEARMVAWEAIQAEIWAVKEELNKDCNALIGLRTDPPYVLPPYEPNVKLAKTAEFRIETEKLKAPCDNLRHALAIARDATVAQFKVEIEKLDTHPHYFKASDAYQRIFKPWIDAMTDTYKEFVDTALGQDSLISSGQITSQLATSLGLERRHQKYVGAGIGLLAVGAASSLTARAIGLL